MTDTTKLLRNASVSKVVWHNFAEKKPPAEGKQYLWARNNWNARNASGERVHSCEVRILYWGKGEFIDGPFCGNGYIDPDQWAEVPYPVKAERPTEDLTYCI